MAWNIVALDPGTTSSRSLLFGAGLRQIDMVQQEFTQHFPAPGWVEHDAEEIWETQWATLRILLERNGLGPGDIAALGITNQRETVVAWDRDTGRPLARAIVWQDRRTAAWCRALKKKKGAEAAIRRKTGLVLDPYFSGSKMRWLLGHDAAVKKAAAEGRLAFGTIDSWLIHKLTGGRRHATEVGNASRTLLMDLRTLAWDESLLKVFGVPASALPEILPSDGDFGQCAIAGLEDVPIRGVAGDQQASLFGHRCFAPGSAKNTYGTGCFLLRNVGRKPVPPPKGLLGTVAWTLKGKTTYAHEGAVLAAGAVVQFLRDGLKLIDAAADSEALAVSAQGNGDVYFVPAFAGLGTPHWDPDARGLLIGLTRGTTRAHVARAALESIAYQSLDLIEAFAAGGKARGLKSLNADGGATRNRFLMQFQADIAGLPVRVNHSPEVTALGAAMLAALGAGLIASQEELERLDLGLDTYAPALTPAERKRLRARWREAVARSRAWARA
jgi:glycerol kinase